MIPLAGIGDAEFQVGVDAFQQHLHPAAARRELHGVAEDETLGGIRVVLPCEDLHPVEDRMQRRAQFIREGAQKLTLHPTAEGYLALDGLFGCDNLTDLPFVHVECEPRYRRCR